MATEAEEETSYVTETEETKVIATPVKYVLFKGILMTETEAKDWDDK